MEQINKTGTTTMTSDSLLRRVSAVLSGLGMLVAVYLVYVKFNPTSLICSGVGDCEAVNTSIYSEIFGIPIAIFGAAAYALILGILLLETRSQVLEKWGPMMVFGLTLAGVLYSAYLTYLEVAVIHAICPYCVTSAVIMTVLFILACFRLRKYL